MAGNESKSVDVAWVDCRIPKTKPLPSVCFKCGASVGLTQRKVKFPSQFNRKSYIGPITAFSLFYWGLWRLLPEYRTATLIGSLVVGGWFIIWSRKMVNVDLPLCGPCNNAWDRARSQSLLLVISTLPLAFVFLGAGFLQSLFSPLVVLSMMLAMPAFGLVVMLVVYARLVKHFIVLKSETESEFVLGQMSPEAARKIGQWRDMAANVESAGKPSAVIAAHGEMNC